jgi:hypothetical protein
MFSFLPARNLLFGNVAIIPSIERDCLLKHVSNNVVEIGRRF